MPTHLIRSDDMILVTIHCIQINITIIVPSWGQNMVIQQTVPSIFEMISSALKWEVSDNKFFAVSKWIQIVIVIIFEKKNKEVKF